MQVANDVLKEVMLTDKEIIASIWTLTPNNNELCELLAETQHPVSLQLKGAKKPFSMADEILYNYNHIESPDEHAIKEKILKIQHNTKPARHPGQVK